MSTGSFGGSSTSSPLALVLPDPRHRTNDSRSHGSEKVDCALPSAGGLLGVVWQTDREGERVLSNCSMAEFLYSKHTHQLLCIWQRESW